MAHSPRLTLIVSLSLLAAFDCGRAVAQGCRTHGFVVDEISGEALIGASVASRTTGIGATSNGYGYFTLAMPSCDDTLRVRFVGYHERVVAAGLLGRPPVMIRLAPSVIDLDTLTVEDQRVERVAPGEILLWTAATRSAPVLLSEPDLMKTAQLLPGVSAGVEGTSGLHVRGGSPDQNLILVDGAPIYSQSHLFGFVSVLNTDAVADARLFRGALPARHGGRLSSVMEVQLREGNRHKFTGMGSVGLISSRLIVEGPIEVDRSSFLVSVRRTYLDAIMWPVRKVLFPDAPDIGYYFQDWTIKLNRTFTSRDRLFLSAYLGNDSFRSSGQTALTLGWRNGLAVGRWTRVWNSSTFMSARAYYSSFNYGVEHQAPNSAVSAVGSGVRDIAVAVDIDNAQSSALSISFGGSVLGHAFTPTTRRFESSGESQDSSWTRITTRRSLEQHSYVAANWAHSEGSEIEAGLHQAAFAATGRTFVFVEPRLHGGIPVRGWILSGSFAASSQFIHLLSNGGVGFPTDLWVPASATLKPERGLNASIGISRIADGSPLAVEFELYTKRMTGVLAFNQGAGFATLSPDAWESQVTSGSGSARGAEVLVRKSAGVWTGWIGYALSWSERKYPALYGAAEVPYRFDRRHDLAVVVSRSLPRRRVSLAWVFQSGVPATLPVAGYYDRGEAVSVYGPPGRYRTRAYHRLDLSVESTRENGSRFTASVYNLYNRRNPLYLFADQTMEFDPILGTTATKATATQYSLLPIIPSISYSFAF